MEKPETQPDLTARIDEQLAATEGHTPGEWVTFYKHKYREHHVSVPIHGSGMMLGLFPDGVPSERPEQDAALIASAPTLRALLVEARAQLAAQADALAAERERANILAWNNDGHAEWMTEHHQDLQRELPDSETTAQLGRLLDRWQRTPGQRQYVALSEVEGQAEALAKAERELAQERRSHSGTIDQRDTAEKAADRLAYALFSIDEIGEHSSSNCPWENAAERLEDMATPQQVSQ